MKKQTRQPWCREDDTTSEILCAHVREMLDEIALYNILCEWSIFRFPPPDNDTVFYSTIHYQHFRRWCVDVIRLTSTLLAVHIIDENWCCYRATPIYVVDIPRLFLPHTLTLISYASHDPPLDMENVTQLLKQIFGCGLRNQSYSILTSSSSEFNVCNINRIEWPLNEFEWYFQCLLKINNTHSHCWFTTIRQFQ